MAVAQLQKLPEPFRSFYARRAARELLALASPACQADTVEVQSNESNNGPTALLSSGRRMPLVGFGTWQIPAEDAEAAVRTALNAGVRHIDTASAYRNEQSIGLALNDALSGNRVRRENMWVTGKLWNSDHGPAVEQVRAACVRSLQALGLDYFDLYLVHWPISSGKASATPIETTWQAMQRLVAEGLVRSIGVANFSPSRLQALCGAVSTTIKPAVNQVEVHPGWRNTQLRQACDALGVHTTAYAPLGSSSGLLSDGAVGELAAANDLTPAQVLLRWGLANGCSVIPKSTSPLRIAENAVATWPSPEPAAMDWSTLEGITQTRQVDGAGLLVGKGAAGSGISNLAELWGEEDDLCTEAA